MIGLYAHFAPFGTRKQLSVKKVSFLLKPSVFMMIPRALAAESTIEEKMRTLESTLR